MNFRERKREGEFSGSRKSIPVTDRGGLYELETKERKWQRTVTV
jgi:hypothetical protein